MNENNDKNQKMKSDLTTSSVALNIKEHVLVLEQRVQDLHVKINSIVGAEPIEEIGKEELPKTITDLLSFLSERIASTSKSIANCTERLRQVI